MKLEVLGPFSTVVTAHGDTLKIVGIPGQILSVDDVVAAALFRCVAPYVREVIPAEPVIEAIREAETVAEEPAVEMVEVPPQVAVPARTRQIKARPGPKPRAKK